MGSDLVGLRPLEGRGLSLSDCSDLPIHQSDCDRQEFFPQRDSPDLEEGSYCIPSTIVLIRHSHLHTSGERRWSC